MPVHERTGVIWKAWQNVSVRVGADWKQWQAAWVYDGGEWKQILRSGLLYVSDNTADYLRAWDLQGARQSGDDISLGSGNWFGVTATATRLFVLDNTADYLRAWDLQGARQSGDDISLGSGNWFGVTATATRLYVLGGITSGLGTYRALANRATTSVWDRATGMA